MRANSLYSLEYSWPFFSINSSCRSDNLRGKNINSSSDVAQEEK